MLKLSKTTSPQKYSIMISNRLSLFIILKI